MPRRPATYLMYSAGVELDAEALQRVQSRTVFLAGLAFFMPVFGGFTAFSWWRRLPGGVTSEADTWAAYAGVAGAIVGCLLFVPAFVLTRAAVDRAHVHRLRWGLRTVLAGALFLTLASATDLGWWLLVDGRLGGPDVFFAAMPLFWSLLALIVSAYLLLRYRRQLAESSTGRLATSAEAELLRGEDPEFGTAGA